MSLIVTDDARKMICAAAGVLDVKPIFASFNRTKESTIIKYNNITFSLSDSSTSNRVFVQITLRIDDNLSVHVETFELFVRVTPQDYRSVQTVHGERMGLTDPARASSIKCDRAMTICGFSVDTLEVSNRFFYTHRPANDNCYVDPRELVWIKEICGPCLAVIKQWGCEDTFRVRDADNIFIKANLEVRLAGL